MLVAFEILIDVIRLDQLLIIWDHYIGIPVGAASLAVPSVFSLSSDDSMAPSPGWLEEAWNRNLEKGILNWIELNVPLTRALLSSPLLMFEQFSWLTTYGSPGVGSWWSPSFDSDVGEKILLLPHLSSGSRFATLRLDSGVQDVIRTDNGAKISNPGC